LEGDLPLEIEPLQLELNALIESNQNIIDRARTQVGNLAHALKTPLAVIANEADDHKGPFADKVAEQTRIMSDQVSHYLERARMAARVGVVGRKTAVLPVVEPLVRVLTRIHEERDIDFKLDCPDAVYFQGEKQDLEEALGNLMDNAGKWAKSSVQIFVSHLPLDTRGRKQLRIRIEDDGPGLTKEQRAEALKRGRRLDETVPGSGLGLSIVAELALSYHGELELGQAKCGGLRADLILPAA
jgi:signal transduction histidine kinase